MGELNRKSGGLMSDLDDLEELLGERRPRIGRRKMKMKARGERLTHCTRGHELTPDNVYIGSQGNRNCKKCARLRILCRED